MLDVTIFFSKNSKAQSPTVKTFICTYTKDPSIFRRLWETPRVSLSQNLMPRITLATIVFSLLKIISGLKDFSRKWTLHIMKYKYIGVKKT